MSLVILSAMKESYWIPLPILYVVHLVFTMEKKVCRVNWKATPLMTASIWTPFSRHLLCKIYIDTIYFLRTVHTIMSGLKESSISLKTAPTTINVTTITITTE